MDALNTVVSLNKSTKRGKDEQNRRVRHQLLIIVFLNSLIGDLESANQIGRCVDPNVEISAQFRNRFTSIDRARFSH